MAYIEVLMLYLVCFHCSVLRISPRQVVEIINFLSLSLASVNSIKQCISMREQVKVYCNWRKEAFLRL